MGVNVHLHFPNNVRIKDVAKVIGILGGIQPVQHRIERSNGFFFDVPGVSITPCGSSLEACAYIEVNHPSFIRREPVHIMYHFEAEFHTDDPEISVGSRAILPTSSPFWVAMCKRLVEHFGGVVDFQDCDSTEIDFALPANPLNGAVDGTAWDQAQRAMFKIKPLTREEIEAAIPFAAYDYDPADFKFPKRKAVVTVQKAIEGGSNVETS